jgi:phosphatidylinositol alpha-1,6-mannosyltransferase
LRHADRVIANSKATALLARQIGVPEDRIGIVHPGVEISEVGPDPAAIRKFRTDLDLGDRPLMLSVGRLSARKGLREFVVNALPAIVKTRPDVMLLIIGGSPADALHAEAQTPESIRDAAREAGVEANLRVLGVIDDARLGAAYRAAALHVFPVRQIPADPEGFGMVAIEAASHGLPTVAFATGGVVDAVADGRSGRLVPPGRYDLFAQAVLELLASDRQWAHACREFARQFAWPEFAKALMSQLACEPARG